MPQAPKEPSEIRLRKFEALYSYARDTYAKEIERLTAVEQKASQHLSLLTVLLGLNTAGFADFIKAWNVPCDNAIMAFRLTFILLSLANLLAFCFFLRVILFTRVPERRADSKMTTFFYSTPYVSVLFSMSKRFLRSARSLRAHVDDKVSYAKIGVIVLLCSIVLAVVCGSSYTIMKAREVHDARSQGSSAGAGKL